MRLVITGARGRLAKLLVPHLADLEHRLVLLDLTTGQMGELAIEAADLSDESQLLPHFAGADAIIHLGGASCEGPYEDIRGANLDGVFNVYECARKAGVRRVVLASSHHVVGFSRSGERVGIDDMRPDSIYAACKVFGEALAHLFWDKYGIESAVLRIGSVQPRPTEPRMLSTWMSAGDFNALVARLLETPSLGCRTLYAISNNAAAWWPIPEVDEWTPQDRAEEAAAPSLSTEGAEQFQGGFFTRLHPFDLHALHDLLAEKAAAGEGP